MAPGSRTNRPAPRAAEAARNDQEVLNAARRLFASRGANASVADIAAEAAVGVGSLYRRYPTKSSLIEALCTRALLDWKVAAEEALGTTDPWDGLVRFVRSAVEFRAGVFEQAAGTFAPSDEMIALADQGQELLEQLLGRAQASGVVRPDLTAMDLRNLIALFSRRLDDRHGRLLQLAVDGLRPSGTRDSSLPGTPPTWERATDRWSIPPE